MLRYSFRAGGCNFRLPPAAKVYIESLLKFDEDHKSYARHHLRAELPAIYLRFVSFENLAVFIVAAYLKTCRPSPHDVWAGP
jgi:hypothetical protein